MGFFDALANRLGYTKTRAIVDKLTSWQAHYAGGEFYRMPDPSKYGSQADYYRKLSWIASAVQILAEACAAVDFEVYQVAGEEMTEIQDHDFERLLANPNPMESRFEFLEAWFSHRILTGNGYAWLNTSGPDEPPSEIWSLPSNMIIPVPDGKMFLKGYLFYPGDGSEIPLEPYEIVHLKRFNPANKFLGLSPIEAIALSAELDLARMKRETKSYAQNNGRLPAILTFPDPIPDNEWKRMKADIDDTANAMRNYLMLRNTKSGVGVVQSSITAQDAQFIENRTFTKEEIYAIFAPGLASMLAVNATEANAKSGKATFNDYAVYPLLESAAQKISNDILPMYGPNLRGKFADVRIRDRAMELQEIATYSQTHTVEEIRRKYYRDNPLGDERDQLFVGQIAASSASSNPGPAIGTGTGALPGETPPQLIDQHPMDEMQPEPMGTAPDEQFSALTQKAWKELEIWQWKASKAVKAGGSAAVEFIVHELPDPLADRIRADLQTARTLEDVKAVFSLEKRKQPEHNEDDAASELTYWERLALKRLQEGKPLDYEPAFLRPSFAGAIAGALEGARNPAQVRAIFENANEWRNYP